ncbi:MAG: heterodisulfide reductase-related iron-sulfur binding cluster [Promethearchaeota archaeon]
METKLKGPIIWHDPCHLARGLGIYDEPRAILDAIRLPYIEFKQTKEDSNCCGSGSGVRSAYPDLAEKATIQRLEEVKGLGARTILTACPFCEFQFGSVIEKNNYDIKVIDLNSLLVELISLL